MASLNNDGIDELISGLNKLMTDIRPALKVALYKAAEVYADNLKAEIQTISVDDDWAHKSDPRVTATSVEVQGLIDGMGIAKFREESGNISTSIGWSGKNADGKSNQRVALAINSGSSIRQKNGFKRRAELKSKAPAQAAMEGSLEKSMKRIMED